MSITKRLLESQEQEDAIKAALQAIIDDGKLTNPASIGIAKKIIEDGNLDSLSEKQRAVFDDHIAPKLKLRCEACHEDIPYISYPEVIANSQCEGMVLCDSCLHFKQQMRKD